MRTLISEDNIELTFVNRLVNDHGWQHIECDPSPDKKDDTSRTGRTAPNQCVLPQILHDALLRLNPQIDPEQLLSIEEKLCKDYSGTDIRDTNYTLYKYLREGIQITTRIKDKEDFDIVRLIDFDHPEQNTFTVVNQMWIKGHYNYRRPDVLLFINGLPVVFIELKKATIKVEEAYHKNLLSYRKDIPNIFAFNQICVLSNGLETRLGAWSASYDYFFEWLKVDNEKEKINRKAIAEHDTSVINLIDGLLRKDRLLDYIENFVFFDRGNKIIAKNHQYLGVNNLVEATRNREDLQGKLGVFWHTQGSGKSYSMVMYVRKVKRKLPGNWTFLVVTDREDLDTQIHKTFVRTEVIGDKEECQPKNSEQLRLYLTQNKQMVFTLIQKFGYDKTKQYPLLSRRNDIIVLVDEAHRTQYQQLGENMHTGLPCANYIAFTGTPLLGAKRLTNQWFGDYVSEYNFAQAVEDKSTVPLFYSRRVPTVELENNCLDDEIFGIEDELSLNDTESRLLENSSSRILEVIKRDDRLEKIAQDIAQHFPRRGFRGKGMVVSVDKYTAVTMYDKVQKYWNEELKLLVKQRNQSTDAAERERLTEIIEYMKRVEMAVVISEEAEETELFAQKGLDIIPHRQKMNAITPEGADIEDRFKNANDPLSLVFVCAMWLTGFDVPSLSTLYLDKPMKGHTLMQAIARANRVYQGKTCGMVIDYVNVFKYMQQALVEYASPETEGDYPAKDIQDLISKIEDTIALTDNTLQEWGISLDKIAEAGDALDQLGALKQALDTIYQNDENKDRFRVLTNTMINLYDAAKPEVFEQHWFNEKYQMLAYMNGLMNGTIDDEKLRKAKQKMAEVLDYSVTSEASENQSDQFVIHQGKVIDLSKIDVDKIRKEIKHAECKAIQIEDVRAFIEKLLLQLINKNCTRIAFSERYRHIIDQYNAGSTANEEYYEKLLQLIDELKQEQSRAQVEGMTDEELEIYDLLIEDKTLTKAELQKVKLAAKNLYQKLVEKKDELMVIDWYKDDQPVQKVRYVIQTTLNTDLPMSYDKSVFNAKTDLLLNHFIDMAVQGYGWVS